MFLHAAPHKSNPIIAPKKIHSNLEKSKNANTYLLRHCILKRKMLRFVS